MSFVALLVCVGCLPQLRCEPYPVAVGSEVVVQAGSLDQPIARLPLEVELPDGALAPLGDTDAAGKLRYTPRQPGRHVFVATINGVRTLAPLAVTQARARWPFAMATVPLGLALLWWNLSRVRGRRAP